MSESARDIDLRLGRWEDVLGDVECDALIVDAPYSERTHSAYRAMAEVGRRELNYACWSAEEVDRFVDAWAPRTRGWFVSLTDHVLAPAWERALERHGRYVFSPLACMEPGARVRLAGDGPTQWSVWAVVGRPKSRAAQKWGALPGGYVVPAREGWRGGGRNGVMGSKPPWLMRAIIRDYSRPGDLVCDPCAGGGTTLLAAAIEGRRAVGAEMDRAHFEIAQKRFARGYTPTLFFRAATKGDTMPRGPKKTEPLSLLPDELDAVAEKYRKALAPIAEREEKLVAELAAVREKRIGLEECLLPLEKLIAEHRTREAARNPCPEAESP